MSLRAKTPSRRTGLSALLRSFSHAKGGGARSVRVLSAVRPGRTGLFVAVLAVALLVLVPVSLGAVGIVKTIGNAKPEAEGGRFSAPTSMAVNQTGQGGVPAGTFYVVDAGNGRIQRFSPNGLFVSAWGDGVNGGGRSEVCTEAAKCAAGSAANVAGALSAPQGTAIDQANGNVYVADQGNGRIDVFTAAGVFEGGFGWKVRVIGAEEKLQFCTDVTGCQKGLNGANAGQLGSSMGGMAVAPAGSPNAGDVYVADKTERRLDEFKPVIEGGIVVGVAFVRGFGWGAETGAAAFQVCATTCHAPAGTGTGTGQFGTNSPSDVAVDSEGDIFALDTANKRVQEFSSASPPTVITATFGSSALSTTFGTGERLNIAVDPSATPNHLLVSGKRSTGSNHIAVLELDHSGAAVQTDGLELTPTSAGGLAVAQASLGGDVYVATTTRRVFEGIYVLNGTVPTASAATGVSAHTAILHGTVISENLETGYHFEYSSDGSTWTSIPATDTIVAPTSGGVTVEQAVTGLTGSQRYLARLAAVRPVGQMTIPSPAVEFTTLASAPAILATQVTNVASSTATLVAQVNPENQPTSWSFEYISEAGYVANGFSFEGLEAPTRAPLTDASAGEGGVTVSLSESVGGLQPGTTYYFRLVASNATGTVDGPETAFATYPSTPVTSGCSNEAFRVFAGSALPDCRAYEQVSPVDKLGGQAEWGSSQIVEASPEGERVTFADNSNLPTSGGASYEPIFIASRNGGAWSSDGLLPPTESGIRAGYFGWNEDLSTSATIISSNAAAGAGLYLRNTATAVEHLALPGEVEGEDAKPAGFAGGSTKLLFEGKAALASGAVAGESNLYLLEDGAVTLADRVPVFPATSCDDASAPACAAPAAGSFAGPYAWFSEGPSLNVGGRMSSYLTQNAISADGSEVFFTEAGSGRLYMRENGVRTVQVSASQRATADPNGEKAAAFLAATSDGSKVFFLSCQKLTEDSTAGSTAAERTCSNTSTQGQDLYEYDTASGTLADLSVDYEVGDLHGAQVVGFLGASKDGADVYFMANGVLAPGATAGNCKTGATSSGSVCNLYLAHVQEGQSPVVTFVARLADAPRSEHGNDLYDWLATWPNPEIKTSRVSADGALLFSSTQKLTGYDNHGIPELYRYRPGDLAPACVSCDPTGVAPTGEALLQTWQFSTKLINGQPLPFLTRNISANGDRVFFQTSDKLVGADVDGELGCPNLKLNTQLISACTDVYEWEAPGEGSCAEASSAYSRQDKGCLYLISPGTGSGYSVFGDADENGDSVFFFTEQSLVPQDGDQLMDLYDARVDGGLASEQRPPTTPSCTDEGCRGATATVPAATGAGSTAISGTGNLLPPAPGAGVKTKTKPLTRAQKLAKALKACAKKPKRRRAGCVKQARKRYGSAQAKKSAKIYRGAR